MTSAIKKFETGEIGHWEIQADTGELFWSDEIYRIHGLDVGGEIDVEAAIQAYHPDDREKVGEYVRRALEEKEDYQFEFRLVRPSGEIRDVKSTGVVRLHPDGEVRSVFGVFQDITVSVKQKRDLEEKSRMLQQAEKLAKFGHWEIQADSGELYWSDEIYRIHGMEVGSEIDVDAAINAYHPDDREMVGEYVRRALEEKKDYQFELRVLKPGGDIQYVKSTGTVHLKPNGDVQSVFGVFQDINDLKKAEDAKSKNAALVNALVEHSPFPVTIKDLEGRYKLVSPAFSRFFNNPTGKIIGNKLGDLLSDETVEILESADQEVVNTGNPVTLDHTFPVELGSNTLQVSKFPITDIDGAVSGIGTVALDISEITEAQKALKHHRDLLEKTVDERTKELLHSEEKYRSSLAIGEKGCQQTQECRQ